MPEEFEIKGIIDSIVGGAPGWVVVAQRDDGFVWQHAIPAHTVTARAMEYDLDEDDDFDDIMEMILHEPFMVDDDPDDPAAAEGYVTTDASGATVAGTLWTAETLQDAREAHKLRIQKVKRDKISIRVPPEQRQAMRAKERAARQESRQKLRQLRQAVREQRRAARGRGDGNPLKARIEGKKEGT